jgi:hypothetical protein
VVGTGIDVCRTPCIGKQDSHVSLNPQQTVRRDDNRCKMTGTFTIHFIFPEKIAQWFRINRSCKMLTRIGQAAAGFVTTAGPNEFVSHLQRSIQDYIRRISKGCREEIISNLVIHIVDRQRHGSRRSHYTLRKENRRIALMQRRPLRTGPSPPDGLHKGNAIWPVQVMQSLRRVRKDPRFPASRVTARIVIGNHCDAAY